MLAALTSGAAALMINAPIAEVRQVSAPIVAPAPARLAIFPTSTLASLIDDEADAYIAKQKALNEKKAALKAEQARLEAEADAKAAAEEAKAEAKKQKAIEMAAARKAAKEAEAAKLAEANAARAAKATPVSQVVESDSERLLPWANGGHESRPWESRPQGCGWRACARDSRCAFDVQAARAAIAPLRVEEMEPWLRLGIAPQA